MGPMYLFISATDFRLGMELSLSLTSKDHSWEGPPSLEVKERKRKGG